MAQEDSLESPRPWANAARQFFVFSTILMRFYNICHFFLTADFEFLQGVFRRFAFTLTTMLKVANFTRTKAVFHGGFHRILPHRVFDLGSQKVVKKFSS